MKLFFLIFFISIYSVASTESRKRAEQVFLKSTKNYDCTNIKNSQDINALDVYEAFVIEDFEGCELNSQLNWIRKVIDNDLNAPGDKSKILGYFCNLSLITPPLKTIDQCLEPQTEIKCPACELDDYKKAMEPKFGKQYKDTPEYKVYLKERLSSKDREDKRKIVLKYLFNIFKIK